MLDDVPGRLYMFFSIHFHLQLFIKVCIYKSSACFRKVNFIFYTCTHFEHATSTYILFCNSCIFRMFEEQIIKPQFVVLLCVHPEERSYLNNHFLFFINMYYICFSFMQILSRALAVYLAQRPDFY